MAELSYNKNIVLNIYKYLIPEGSSILYYGALTPDELNILEASTLVCASQNSAYEDYMPKQKFDYIILDLIIGKSDNICQIFQNITPACTSQTRLFVHQHNNLWKYLLILFNFFLLNIGKGTQNWITRRAMYSYLDAAGFDVTRRFEATLIPVRLLFAGPLFNKVISVLPFTDCLKLDQFIISRLKPENITDEPLPSSLTICITVRNERGNIEPMVTAIQQYCEKQDILFVEGHSTDNTKEEIERMIEKYPKKNISLIGQPGIGQGDAIRVGFKAAEGDIIILYEGDGTSIPEDIPYFYDAMRKGRFEFIEGSRFVYPLIENACLLQIILVIFSLPFGFLFS